MISTMIPEIWLVLVSRNVKGMPVGVEPTRTTCWASLAPINPNARAVATTTRQSDLANMGRTLLEETAQRRICLDHRRGTVVPSPGSLGDDNRKRTRGCQTAQRTGTMNRAAENVLSSSNLERRRTSGSVDPLRVERHEPLGARG